MTGRRVPTLGSFRDVPWLQPYPDELLGELAPAGEQPDAALVARETIELTFIAVIQLLPPRHAEGALALISDDIRVTMPPNPWLYEGRAEIGQLIRRAFETPMGEWRLVPIGANTQPAAASYLCRPGETTFNAFKIDVLRVVDGRIAEITTFGGAVRGVRAGRDAVTSAT